MDATNSQTRQALRRWLEWWLVVVVPPMQSRDMVDQRGEVYELCCFLLASWRKQATEKRELRRCSFISNSNGVSCKKTFCEQERSSCLISHLLLRFPNHHDSTMTAPRSPSSSKVVLDYVYSHFIKGAAVQKGSQPGFAHALQLSYQTLDRQRLSVDLPDRCSHSSSSSSQNRDNFLIYLYQTSVDHVPKLTMGLLTAVMDELTTVALFRTGLPSPPGVSLHMSTERALGADTTNPHHMPQLTLENLSEVNVINQVTKLGKTVAHTRTEFRCPRTHQLLASSTHIKYLPMGSAFLDWAFSSPSALTVYHQLFVKLVEVPIHEPLPLFTHVLQQHIEYTEYHPRDTTLDTATEKISMATFTVTQLHTNPFGALHGGCHAMIMEDVATRHVQQRDNRTLASVQLQSLQIEYLSAAPLGATLDVVCRTVSQNAMSCQVRVQLWSKRHKGRVVPQGRLVSEGRFWFTASSRL